ncbi:Riboflavin kinase, FMN adenylyltransferase [Giardia lamblia P15]|uniref:riboflavin kinase n=1 Tax=Giardia intestinalis (strain P15) TaxID=658858 RepID=E1EZ48_GIAIA|nr:Riboflavin kinase, FMN adenylyltransferase [Giardia lamblia P15]
MIFCTKGTVVRGFQRGRVINFKTANLVLSNQDQLEDGVFSGWARVELNGDVLPAVISYGKNPTFANKNKTLEVHILATFPEDFYGATLYTTIQRRLRSPVKFSGIEELNAQIKMDIENAQIDYTEENRRKAELLFKEL